MKTTIIASILAGLIIHPSVHANNLIANGGADEDTPTFFLNDAIEYSIHQGDPITGMETANERSFSFKFLQDATERAIAVGLQEQIYVDPSLRYRIRTSFYSTGSATISCGGYASNGESGGKPLVGPDGVVWQYNVRGPDGKPLLETPTTEWVEMEAVIGPIGADADYFWLPDTLQTGIVIWVNAPAETILYVDNISVEEMD